MQYLAKKHEEDIGKNIKEWRKLKFLIKKLFKINWNQKKNPLKIVGEKAINTEERLEYWRNSIRRRKVMKTNEKMCKIY